MAKILEFPQSKENFEKSLDNTAAASNKFPREDEFLQKMELKRSCEALSNSQNLIREILDHKLEKGYKQLGTQVD